MNSERRLADPKEGPPSRRVTDPARVDELQQKVIGIWFPEGFPHRTRLHFPGPQPASISIQDIRKLKNPHKPYFACLKCDGMRFMLYCCNTKKSYMIDRSFSFFEVGLHWKEEDIYKGTLLDGELVRTRAEGWAFVIHDCIMFLGEVVAKKALMVRYQNVGNLINQYWNPDDSPFLLRSKKFYRIPQLRELFKEMDENTTYNVDGVIFTPADIAYTSLGQFNLMKWKTNHTFDFLVRETQDGIDTYVTENRNHILYASIPKTSSLFSEFEGKLKTLVGYRDGCIVEFIYDQGRETYDPILVRTKTHPNSLRTVKKTHENISENIQRDFLLQQLGIP